MPSICSGTTARACVSLPLVKRKRRLRRLIRGRDRLLFAEQIQGKGIELFEAICSRDIEGIVAKHRLGPYAATPVTWFKVLNLTTLRSAAEKEYSTSSASASTFPLCEDVQTLPLWWADDHPQPLPLNMQDARNTPSFPTIRRSATT